MKSLNILYKLGILPILLTIASCLTIQAENAIEPCEDTSWLEIWMENPDCCFGEILEYDSPEYGTLYYVYADPDNCFNDGPSISYVLDCEGNILCDTYSEGASNCENYDLGVNVDFIWATQCVDVYFPCEVIIDFMQLEDGWLYFLDPGNSASEPVSWLWEIDGQVVSTEVAFEWQGELFEIYDVCLTHEVEDECIDTDCITINMGELFGCIDPALINEVGCDDVFEPVCACGVTYDNQCVAENWFGVVEWTSGDCESSNDCIFNPAIEIIFEECYGTEDEPQSLAVAIYSFQANSTGGDYLYWTFSNLWANDLENDFVENVEFITVEDGEPFLEPYEICLTVGDSALGCEETICEEIYPEEFCLPINACIDENIIDPTIDCTTVFEPVCGCDGITYENECVAQTWFGIVDFTDGPCETGCNTFYEYWMLQLGELELCFDYCEIGELGDLEFTTLSGFDNCTFSEDGQCLIFTPIPGFTGEEIIFVFACDTEGDCMEIEALVHIGNVVEDDYYSIENYEVLDGNVLENDNLPDFWDLASYTETSFGTLEFDLASGTFIYDPEGDFVGLDSFTYMACNNDGMSDECWTATVFIDVEEEFLSVTPDFYIDLQADEVSGIEGETIEVCVLDNDYLPGDNYILTFESDIAITVEGDCFIIEGDLPPGIYEMFYTFCLEDQEDECYESTVTITIDGFDISILAEDDYEVSNLNTEVIIEPLINDIILVQTEESIVLTIVVEPENGTVTTFTDEDCEVEPCQVFVYTPNPNFEGQDQFTYELCIGENCDTATVYIEVGTDCSEFCVWPGDTNNDGIANNLDLLPIGFYYNEMGPIREEANIDWQAQPANNWETSFTTNGADVGEVNLKMIDCDGNGVIEEEDLQAIYANYDKSHGKTEEHVAAGNPMIRLEIEDEMVEAGSWINLNVLLEETDEVPLEEVYGIAFQIDYFNEIEGETVIPADSIQMQFDDSWFNNDGADHTLGLFQNLYQVDGSSKADIAYVRTNKEGVNGSGDILSMSCFITANITGKTQGVFPIYFYVKNAMLVLSSGETMALNVSSTSTEVEIIETELPTHIASTLEVYPNPTNNYIQIDFGNTDVQKLNLYNNLGQLVKYKEEIKTNNLKWNLQDLPMGIYLLSIETSEGVLHKKIQLLR